MPCFCLDLDGTLYKGSEPIKHAADFLNKLNQNGIKHIALTNCPERGPQGVSDKLAAMGIHLASENVLTAGMTAVSMIKNSGVKAVYVLGSEALKNECLVRGLEVRDHNVQAVLIGHSTDICYDGIKTATVLAFEGAKLYCTNPDNNVPVGNSFIPHSGAIAAAVECATGKKCFYVGKPAPHMIYDALQMMSCNKEDIFMVGDRLDTDIAFGKNCGVKTCLMLTGATNVDMIKNSGVKPDYIFENLDQLYNSLV